MTFDPTIAFENSEIVEESHSQGGDSSTAFDEIDCDQKYVGNEPTLGGQLRQKAVWVDEASCIGCTYCSCVATNTFAMEQDLGRARAFRQDGDSEEIIQEAIETCPVDCIHWVDFEQLPKLKEKLERTSFRSPGLPPQT